MLTWRLRNKSTRVYISYQEAKLANICKCSLCFTLLVQMDCNHKHTVFTIKWVTRHSEDRLKLIYLIVPTQTKQLATSCLFQAWCQLWLFGHNDPAQTFQRFFLQSSKWSSFPGLKDSTQVALWCFTCRAAAFRHHGLGQSPFHIFARGRWSKSVQAEMKSFWWKLLKFLWLRQ